MGKFSINDLMNSRSKGEIQNKNGFRHIKVYTEEMIPSEENFYSMDSIEELAKSILLVGLQQPIVLAKVSNQYKVISGHRRRQAIKWLIEQGYEQFKEVECLYSEMSEAMFNLSLIVGNAFTRKMTDYDLIMQEKRLKEALVKAREAGEIEIKGRLRECIAELMDMSSTKVAQIEAINNNLTDEVKEEVMKGQIGFSSAYEMSKLPEEEQKEVLEKVKQGDVIGKDIKQLVIERKEQRRKEEQIDKEAEPTLRQPACKEQLGQVINVSETDTHAEREEEAEDYTEIEYEVPEVLGQLLEMYQLITENEFVQIVEILQACNERVKRDGD